MAGLHFFCSTLAHSRINSSLSSRHKQPSSDQLNPPTKKPQTKTQNSTARFTFTSGGKAVTTACPGAKLSVALSFASPRLALVTADAGTFAKSAGGKCPARIVLDRTTGVTRAAAQQTADFTVPCAQKAPLVFKVTSATGEEGAFLQASATLPVSATGCPRC